MAPLVATALIAAGQDVIATSMVNIIFLVILLSVLFSTLAAGTDYYTTERMLDRGHYELNPMIGKYPTDTQLATKFWAGHTLFLIVTHYLPKWRMKLLDMKVIINLGLAIHNERL